MWHTGGCRAPEALGSSAPRLAAQLMGTPIAKGVPCDLYSSLLLDIRDLSDKKEIVRVITLAMLQGYLYTYILEIFQEMGIFWCFFCPFTTTEIGLIK